MGCRACLSGGQCLSVLRVLLGLLMGRGDLEGYEASYIVAGYMQGCIELGLKLEELAMGCIQGYAFTGTDVWRR